MTRSTAATNNIALEWFLVYGKNNDLDFRTICNVTEEKFVEFAKSHASEEEKAIIDECVKRLTLTKKQQEATLWKISYLWQSSLRPSSCCMDWCSSGVDYATRFVDLIHWKRSLNGWGCEMKERPILFNAEMVRAILEGRKTQTRRIMKPQPSQCTDGTRGGHWWPSNPHQSMLHVESELQNDHEWRGLALDAWRGNAFNVKFLWVRETFAAIVKPEEATDGIGRAWYYADAEDPGMVKWTPSIHMPRWSSRILLEITSVRVERLQDISEEDALAEGVMLRPVNPSRAERMARDAYQMLWESINGPGSWDVNPWVWVIEFKRINSKQEAR